VARVIAGELKSGVSKPVKSLAFAYADKGEMATIGRSASVAKIGRVKFHGGSAWLAWLGLHLFFLIGLRNRLSVLLQWIYAYFTYRRGARIIMGLDRLGPPPMRH